jgi:sulfur transfer complex TusBCD TusB component (DsrH family)
VFTSSLSQNTASSVGEAIKILTQRDQYSTCHITIPGEPDRLPAIALNGQFYSFFRSSADLAVTLKLVMKLTQRGDAVVLTQTKAGHVIWLTEPDAQISTPLKGAAARNLGPNFGPADCWILSDRQPGYQPSTLKVPDLPETVPGLAIGQKLFSLYRRDHDGSNALKLAGRLTQRGDEVVVLLTQDTYVLCVREPVATVA